MKNKIKILILCSIAFVTSAMTGYSATESAALMPVQDEGQTITMLYEAIKNGDVDTVRRIATSRNVNAYATFSGYVFLDENYDVVRTVACDLAPKASVRRSISERPMHSWLTVTDYEYLDGLTNTIRNVVCDPYQSKPVYTPPTGITPLHYAVSWFNPEIIQVLLQVGANPNLKNIHFAYIENDQDLSEQLKAPVSQTTAGERKPLSIVDYCQESYKDELRALLGAYGY